MAVRLLVVAGDGSRMAVTRLLADARLAVVDSPRHADVLLVVGAVPSQLGPALRAVHDQLPSPRAVRWWTTAGGGGRPRLPGVDRAGVIPDADPVPALVQALQSAPQPLLGRDEPPNPWRGEGPYGTGGEGMMGGTPYGRPMTMTADDLRDGLALDRLDLTVGPLLSPLPTGLTLEVALQGDVLVDVRVGEDRFDSDPATWRGGRPPADGATAPLPTFADPSLTDPTAADEVAVAEVELLRARHHLGAAARTLRMAGLGAFARRTARLAVDVRPGDGRRVRRLSAWLRRTAAVRGLLVGVGVIGPEVAGAGPTARAAGAAVDARTEDPVYRALGFSVVTQSRGDALGRFRQRLAEAAQALDLAGTADGRRVPVRGVEGPDGPVADAGTAQRRLLAALPQVLPGMEWGDAVTTIDSLDLDLAAVARSERVGVR